MWIFIRLRPIKRALRRAALVVVPLLAAVAFVNFRYPLKYYGFISENAELTGLDPVLICAMIRAESGFDPEARSGKGASGLMQLTELTADWMAEEMELSGYRYERIFEPELNIQIGSYYVGRLLRQYGGDLTLALAAYNAGSGNVAKWLDKSDYSADGKSLVHIPFEETRNYIKRIDSNIKVYRYLLRISEFFHK